MKDEINIPSVNIATKSVEDQLTATLTLAFSTDPMARWLLPEPKDFLMYYPPFVEVFGGKAFEHESAYYIEGYAGVALWLPPKIEPDEERMMSYIEKVTQDDKKNDLYDLVGQMDHYHPDEPCWYLPLLGVDPSQQNKGYGSLLLKDVLMRCDRERKPAYLETSNPRNIPFYERLGFKIVGKMQAGSSPILYAMLRTS